MKKIITLFIMVLGFSIQAQNNCSFDFGADFVSRYIWRGAEFGAVGNQPATPHLQPYGAFTYTMGKSSLSLGFWASYGLDSKYSENDLYINYSVESNIGTISLTVSDYYYPYLDGEFSEFSNFDGDGNGAHTIEFNLSYTLPGKYPFSFMVSSNVHNDVPDNESLYFQVSYPFTVSKVDLNVFVGAANGRSVWHSITSDDFEFINVGFSASKSIKITDDYSIPLGMEWIYNPHLEKSYLVIKVSI